MSHKISRTLAPATIICDNIMGQISINSIDGTKIVITDILNFENWSEKFKNMIIEDHVCHMEDRALDSTINVFFERLTNMLHSHITSSSEKEIEATCDNILNVVSQHIMKGESDGRNI